MKKVKIKLPDASSIKTRDPNAASMWGRVKSQTFRDKTKYNRKVKHKNREEF